MNDYCLTCSIVLYKHTIDQIQPTLESIAGSSVPVKLVLVDNSPEPIPNGLIPDGIEYIFTGRNLGFGAAHNLAIRKYEHETPFHLILNPDVTFEPGILEGLVKYMESHHEAGLVMPKVLYPDGRLQYLCKLLPSPYDLIARRFLPQRFYQKRAANFCLLNSGYNRVMNVPSLSGCFMLVRNEVWQRTGVFDERFFLYAEDIDLSRRIHKDFKTIYYPDLQIIHHHQQDSYRSLTALKLHMKSAVQYFNKWGWVSDRERTRMNSKILDEISRPPFPESNR